MGYGFPKGCMWMWYGAWEAAKPEREREKERKVGTWGGTCKEGILEGSLWACDKRGTVQQHEIVHHVLHIPFHGPDLKLPLFPHSFLFSFSLSLSSILIALFRYLITILFWNTRANVALGTLFRLHRGDSYGGWYIILSQYKDKSVLSIRRLNEWSHFSKLRSERKT